MLGDIRTLPQENGEVLFVGKGVAQIREMEPAWEKDRWLKFQPTQIRIGRQGDDRYENRVTITNIARWE